MEWIKTSERLPQPGACGVSELVLVHVWDARALYDKSAAYEDIYSLARYHGDGNYWFLVCHDNFETALIEDVFDHGGVATEWLSFPQGGSPCPAPPEEE